MRKVWDYVLGLQNLCSKQKIRLLIPSWKP